MAVAITLTPGSSPGQALTLSHQERGDIEVLPEGVFGVGRVVSHLACEMSQLVSCVVHLGDFMEILGYVRFGWRSVFCVVLLCGCMNPLRRFAPRPPFAPLRSTKRGGFAPSPNPRRPPLSLRSRAVFAGRMGRATARVGSTVWSSEGGVPLRMARLGVGANRVRRLPGCQQESRRCDQCGSLPLDSVRLF